MPASFAVALGVLAVLTVVRFVQRAGFSGRARTIMTETKDPEAAKQMLRELVSDDAAKETARRAELWQHAQTDIGAAQELRRLLQDDLRGHDLAREHFRDVPEGAGVLRVLEEDRVEIEKQLARLDALMEQLDR